MQISCTDVGQEPSYVDPTNTGLPCCLSTWSPRLTAMQYCSSGILPQKASRMGLKRLEGLELRGKEESERACKSLGTF